MPLPKIIECGVPGMDDLCGGLPENSATLVYGPPKVGKSVFCYEFALHGLELGEPCLYLATDYSLRQLRQNLLSFKWDIEAQIEQGNIYIIDALSNLSGVLSSNMENYKLSSVQDPTDLMVKVGLGSRYLYRGVHGFRSVLDSLTTLFAFNPDKMVVRLINAYTRRIKEAGGTPVIAYTQGVADPQIENLLKSGMDNIIHLDGEKIHLESILGGRPAKAPYRITENGLFLEG